MLRHVPPRAAMFAAVMFAPHALAGPDWIEGPSDAGGLLASAHLTLGTGNLNSISGTLSAARGNPDLEDMYLLRVLTPSAVSFQVLTAEFDPQLFLFNVTLPGETLGLLANDNAVESPLSFLTSPATDNTGAALLVPGVYALAISGVGNVPLSRTGPIFNLASPTEISGADGPGGLNPLSGWSGGGATGNYIIRMNGVGFYDTPAPGTGAALLAALGGAAVRRRRR